MEGVQRHPIAPAQLDRHPIDLEVEMRLGVRGGVDARALGARRFQAVRPPGALGAFHTHRADAHPFGPLCHHLAMMQQLHGDGVQVRVSIALWPPQLRPRHRDVAVVGRGTRPGIDNRRCAHRTGP